MGQKSQAQSSLIMQNEDLLPFLDELIEGVIPWHKTYIDFTNEDVISSAWGSLVEALDRQLQYAIETKQQELIYYHLHTIQSELSKLIEQKHETYLSIPPRLLFIKRLRHTILTEYLKGYNPPISLHKNDIIVVIKDEVDQHVSYSLSKKRPYTPTLTNIKPYVTSAVVDLFHETVHKAIFLAHLKQLKKRFNEDENFEVDISEIERLQWKGSPGEFGAIFDELISKGYIQTVNNKTVTVRLLQKFFEVRSKEGNEMHIKYLLRCFDERKRKWDITDQLNIPDPLRNSPEQF